MCHIVKHDSFLQFEFLNYGTEREHLKQQSDDERSEFEKAVRDMLEEEPGISRICYCKEAVR